MYAHIMAGPGRLGLGTVPTPGCGADEVLLRTDAVSICSTDVSYYLGHLSSSTWPLIPGHEYVGTVVEAGTAVADSVAVGDRVCYWGQTDFGGMAEYRAIRPLFPGRGAMESTWFTDRGFADANQAAAVVLPPDLAPGAATVLEPLTSVLRSMLWNPPRPGDRCLVLGAGPSALLAVQVLRGYFGTEVVVFERDQHRIKTALACGADRAFDPRTQHEEIAQLIADSKGQAVDYVFDALPHQAAVDEPDARELAMGLLRPGGTYVVYGASAMPQRLSTWMVLAKGLKLSAAPFDVTEFPMARSARVLETALRLMTSGLVDGTPVISATVDLLDEEAVVGAFRAYGRDGAMKTSMVARPAR